RLVILIPRVETLSLMENKNRREQRKQRHQRLLCFPCWLLFKHWNLSRTIGSLRRRGGGRTRPGRTSPAGPSAGRDGSSRSRRLWLPSKRSAWCARQECSPGREGQWRGRGSWLGRSLALP